MSDLIKEYIDLLIELKPRLDPDEKKERDRDKKLWDQFQQKAEKLFADNMELFDSPYVQAMLGSDSFDAPVDIEELYGMLTGKTPSWKQIDSGKLKFPKVTAQQAAKNARRWADSAGDNSSYSYQRLVRMMRDVKKFIIKQEKLAKKRPPEAPAKAPFQQYLFAQDRSSVPKEPDTPAEKKVKDELSKHYQGYDKKAPLSTETGLLLKKLGDKGWYEDILAVPDEYEIAYRGMNVNKKQLQKLLGRKDIGKQDIVDKNMKYVPRAGSSSWTVAKKVAKGFSGEGEYHIILWAEIPSNKFVMNPDAAREIERATDAIPSEREVIGVGTVKVFRIEYKSSDYGYY